MNKCVLAVCVSAPLWMPGLAFSDVVPKQEFRERVPVPAQQEQVKKEDVKAMQRNDSGWGTRIEPGITWWTLGDEDSSWGPALYADVFNRDMYLNLRVGVEGAHLNMRQENAADWAEWEDRHARISFIRIPFAVEYMTPLFDDDTMFFIGGGPDLLHSANDHTETTVGAHLGARIGYNFTRSFGVAVEGGYMWARFDSSPGNVNLDGAYITPTLTYTF